MRVLSVGNFLNPSWDGSLPDEEHIAKALEDLGHEVTRLQREETVNIPSPISGDFNPYHPIYTKYDFVLVSQWDSYPPYLARILRDSGDKVVYWAFDYQADGQEWHERLVEGADLYLSKRIADSKYPNWQWLAQDFAPEFLQPSPQGYKDIDILFTGSYLPWAETRNSILKAVDEQFNLVIHSVNAWPGFRDVRPPIMDDGLPELYNRAKVILSIDHTLEAGYWSDRNAQIVACGRKPLFHYVPLSEARFGDKVTYFYNQEDCMEKIEQQLREPLYEGRTEGLYVKDRVKDLLTIVGSIL